MSLTMFRLLIRTLGCVWLFCGFLIAASMDRVADPPAIQPHADARHAACVAAVALHPQLPGSARVPGTALAPSEAFRLCADAPDSGLRLFFCASDTSPPLRQSDLVI